MNKRRLGECRPHNRTHLTNNPGIHPTLAGLMLGSRRRRRFAFADLRQREPNLRLRL